MINDIYFKQIKLFDPKKSGQLKIHIYGAGSIGSHVCMGLAKIGFDNITIYDYDIVEKENLPAQFFNINSLKDKLNYKVNEIKKLVEEFTGKKIETNIVKINENSKLDISENTIHILAVDNIKTRIIITKLLQNFNLHLIDGRIGGFGYEKYYVKMNNKNQVKRYLKTLKGKFSDLECGMKCLWVVNSYISSKIILDCIKISQNKYLTKEIQGNILNEEVLVRK